MEGGDDLMIHYRKSSCCEGARFLQVKDRGADTERVAGVVAIDSLHQTHQESRLHAGCNQSNARAGPSGHSC